jgi:hypothetical protein
MKNGINQPILATRKETRKCNITVIPGDKMSIGDLIYVFGEYWLCMELYTDEYGVTYGVLWMCNHLFRFQNRTSEIIEKYGIIDDGSYTKGGEKAIPVTVDKYTCYISYDEESAGFYIDKRIAIDTVQNNQGEMILEVGKVTWIDKKSKNYGEGSHLMTFRIDNDVYNPESDNIEELVCDFIPEDAQEKNIEPEETALGYIFIEGKDAVRIGTGRTFTAQAILQNGTKAEKYTEMEWSLDGGYEGIELSPNGDKCLLRLPLDDALIGSVITLRCVDKQNKYASAKKEVAVITIG